PGEELQLIGHVILGFIGDAATTPVDYTIARIGFLHDRQPRHRVVRRLDRGAPPSTVHQPRSGADGERGAKSIAGVGTRRRAPLGTRWLGQILLPHGLVVLETSRRKHDPTSCSYDDSLTAAKHRRSHYPAFLIPQQILHGSVEP